MVSIFDSIKKELGSDGIFSGDDDFISEVSVIPSGSLSLDDAIGPWGLPQGRIIQYAGPESSGKTLMAFMAIREWQKRSPHNIACFFDAEQTFMPQWADALGVDTQRIQIYKKSSAKDIFNSICGIPNEKDAKKSKKKKGILDIVKENGGAKESGLGIIVVDSIAAMQAPQEEVSEAGKVNISPLARFLPPELRKLTPLLAESDVILIAINQLRVKVGTLYGNPEDSTGGKAFKHFCSLMVNFAAVMNKDSYIFDSNGDKIGHKIRAKIQKNKVGIPFRETEFEIKYLEGVINSHKEIADLGIKYNIIERPTNVTYSYNNEILAKGRDNLYDTIKDNDKLQAEIFKNVKQAKQEGLKPSDKKAFRDDEKGE